MGFGIEGAGDAGQDARLIAEGTLGASSLQFAHQPHHGAGQAEVERWVFHKDGLEVGIGGLQPAAAFRTHEPLYRGFAILEGVEVNRGRARGLEAELAADLAGGGRTAGGGYRFADEFEYRGLLFGQFVHSRLMTNTCVYYPGTMGSQAEF